MRARRAGAWVVALIAVIGLSACAAADDVSVDGHQTQEQFYAAQDEWAEYYVECLRAKGVDAEIVRQPNGDVSIAPAYGAGAEVSNGLDAECTASVGNPPEAPEASRALLVGLYELLLEQAQCGLNEGFVIPEPPARDSWVETYGADSWMPTVAILDSGQDHLAFIEACPEPSPVEAEILGTEILGE